VIFSTMYSAGVRGPERMPGERSGVQPRPGLRAFSPRAPCAPDIAGKGIANPTALMLSSALMLMVSAATRLRSAIEHVYAEQKHLPPDVGGSASTNEFTDAVIAGLG
jgi:isocitrate/isopropylmalate dehydrogenase